MVKNFSAIDDVLGSGSHSKEVEPGTDFSRVKETVENEPNKEVEKFITPRAESIELPPDLKKMGLQAVQTTKYPTYKNLNLPITDEKIVVGLHAPVTSSLRWLATFAIYLLARAHLALKTVHGKVVRVIKT